MEATVEQITAAISALNDKYWYVVMALLFVAGVWFTIRTVGVQVRMLPEMLRSVVAKGPETGADDGVLGELLRCIRVIKMNGWEKAFIKRIEGSETVYQAFLKRRFEVLA